jgi:membrane protease YdiL (CAAX protease family)
LSRSSLGSFTGAARWIVTFAHRAMYGAPDAAQAANVTTLHPSLLAIPFAVMNPFFEELIVRAYLMTEIQALTKSRTLAIFLSTVVQTTYHLYYGWVRALSMMFLFLVYSLYYSRKQRILPVIVSHGILDLVGLVRYWRVRRPAIFPSRKGGRSRRWETQFAAPAFAIPLPLGYDS